MLDLRVNMAGGRFSEWPERIGHDVSGIGRRRSYEELGFVPNRDGRAFSRPYKLIESSLVLDMKICRSLQGTKGPREASTHPLKISITSDQRSNKAKTGLSMGSGSSGDG